MARAAAPNLTPPAGFGRALAMLLMVALPMLAGCDTRSGPFRQVDGGWRYKDTAIPDADARTFAALDDHYAKDATRVYFADLVIGDGERRPYVRSVPLPGAQAATFRVLDAGHAADAGQAYYREQILSRDVASFAVLAFDYAKTATQVDYRGAAIPGADAATFGTLDAPTEAGDAHDGKRAYSQGRPVQVR